ncbi:MAG: biotin-dependent carboxyltransferase family protein [Proteobacteria bacterium]|nr:biotin-dependent carboxyltransferase family protein [Pseudomonadota bacterium]
MTTHLEVIDAGLGVSIQDLGRPGYRAIGVPLSGALDPLALAAANALAGNGAALPALEIRFSGPTLMLAEGEATRLALMGAATAEIIGPEGEKRLAEPQTSFLLRRGEKLKVGRTNGTAYLAVAGGFGVERMLGSAATYARAGLGGIKGGVLSPKDQLPCNGVGEDEDALHQSEALPYASGPLRVLPGPQEDQFTPEALDVLLSAPFSLSPAMDRMGMRLEGARLNHNDRGADILSDGVLPGAIQVPGDGQPIILLADGQTTGGYAKIACVISADLPRLAHLRPGDTLRFARVDRTQAAAARRAQAEAFARWKAGIEIWKAPGRIDIARLYTTELITGVTAGYCPA